MDDRQKSQRNDYVQIFKHSKLILILIQYPEWLDTAAIDDDELSAAGRRYGRGFGYRGRKGYRGLKRSRGFKGYGGYRSFIYAPRFKKFIVKRVAPKKGSF
ncbi:hypothetical protein HK102_011848, partial [Quaeritorhiza haematococci]